MRICYFVTLKSFFKGEHLNAVSNTVNEVIITVELNFIIDPSRGSQEHVPSRIRLYSLFHKPVLRKGDSCWPSAL